MSRYVIDYLIWSAITNRDFVDSLSDAATGGRGPVLVGQSGEKRVRAKYDIGEREYYRVNGHKRISDGTNEDSITEVKNVKYLWYSRQLQDAWQHAQDEGKDFDLYVRGGENKTRLSPNLQKMIDENDRFHLRYIP
ncbi:hypothetical protein AXH35_09280 [Acidipropionibacterium acidipropionici]|uniref:Tox-REase-7 domain-containing protein n=1 Tax=Acidipropionibacterium acidipropionici TaxID=1748 RepID=A0AAC8YGM8_9ACTN|nr:hypothetical protein AXH35_09280 [Acidipropionibacterium acidipropionici]AOZ47082.1 hypothetical protein A8L58_10720 [Acidipropionibacterium acidipropionici]